MSNRYFAIKTCKPEINQMSGRAKWRKSNRKGWRKPNDFKKNKRLTSQIPPNRDMNLLSRAAHKLAMCTNGP